MVQTGSMNYIDTHCHIHDSEFFDPKSASKALKESVRAGVMQMIGIGTSLEDSKQAVNFANSNPDNYWVAVGIHPHEAGKLSVEDIEKQLTELDDLATEEKVVAIGECGFDFYYNDRSEALHKQTILLEGQLEIARKHGLPVSFHVREAFDDFWPVYDKFKVSGVLHSFTDRAAHLEKALQRGLFIGINGIATFTSHQWQKDMFRTIALENVVLETDSPFLTPSPRRGTINTPENVIYITEFMAELRGEDARTIADITTRNARKLFRIS